MADILTSYWPWWSEANPNKNQFALALFTLLFIIFWYFRFTKKSEEAKGKSLPGPYGLPLVGYLPFVQPKLHNQFTDLAKIYGPIFKLRLLNKVYVVISSASLVKEVVRDQDVIFANRDPPASALIATYGGNDISFAPYGPEWKKLRKVFVREMLSNSNLEAGYDLRREEVIKGMKDLYTKINTPVDVGEVGVSILINIMMNMLWGGASQGKEGAQFTGEFKSVVAELMHLFGTADISEFFPILTRFDLQGIQKRTIRINKWFDKLYESEIKRCRGRKEINETEKQKQSFLQLLLELEKSEDSANSITMSQLKAILMNIIVGGTDTTTTTLEWTMAEIMNNTEVMRKVHEELNKVVGQNNTVEEHHLLNLLYLDCVLKESMRLHPALPLLVPRCPSKSVIVGGYTVPKGSRVFINITAIQKDPRYWDNPLEFVPERFLVDSELFDFYGNNLNYLPFGSGRRVCPGIPLGEKMLKFVFGSLLHSFEWRLPDGEEVDFEEKVGLVVQKLKPLIAIPKPRLSKELYD